MKKTFTIAIVLSAALVFAGSLLAPVEVRFVESITQNTALSGFIFGFASVALVVLSQVIAKLSNIHGRRTVIIGGALFGIVYALLYSTVASTLAVLGVKFAWAFAIAATNPVLAAYVQNTLVGNPRQGRYFGYYYSIQSIAGSGGALLGGYLFETWGFTEVAIALAIAYAVATSVAFMLPRERTKTSVEVESSHKVSTDHSVFALLKVVFKKPALRFYLASNIATSINWGVKPFLWPLVIFALSGSDTTTGAIFATMGVVAFFLLPFAGMIADKVGPYKVITVELFLFSITGITMALTGSVVVFWIAAAVYTIAEVMNLAQSMILTEELEEEIRSEAMALDTSFDQILGFTSPLAAGVLASFYSPAFALLCFMVLYIGSFVITFLIGSRNQLFARSM